MAKYEDPFEDTQDMYTQAIDACGLSANVNITILVDNKAKEIFKVNKANDLLKFRTGDDIIIVLNEKIFEGLEPEQQAIVVEESLASIHFDGEKEKLVISKPDVATFSGVLSKHTFVVWDALRESIKTLYAAEKQAEDEAKAITEKGKKKQF